MTADELLEVIDCVQPDDKRKLALAINKIQRLMKENTPVVSTQETKDYVTRLTQDALQQGVLTNYSSDDLIRTKKSTQHKEVIREVIKQFDLVADVDNPALSLAWSKVKKSKSILELRTNLEMYITIKESIHQNNMQEFVDFIDEQDRQIQTLLDYKRIQEELFGIVFNEDEELKLLSDIENAKLKFKLTDEQVCKMFDCSRRKLGVLRQKYKLTVL